MQIGWGGTPAEQVVLPPAAHEVLGATAAMYGRSGFVPPWVGYLALEDNVCVGTCAFTSAPRAGRVEIAYFTFPGHYGRGIGTQMAAALLDIAATVPGVIVTAQTLARESASTRILARLGFQRVGTIEHPEEGAVWEWQLSR